MPTYYNEFDPFAAQWLHNLREEKLIPYGLIDTRSIKDVPVTDPVFRTHKRAHFFAGIAGWELALQIAGFPSHLNVWTGSCPCQPYSIAGKRKGDKDERNLWPHWKILIDYHRPAILFGEQTQSKDGLAWLSGVRVDLEAMGYEVGGADLCAASVASPQKRARLFWGAALKSAGRSVAGAHRNQQQPAGARAGKSHAGIASGNDLVGDGITHVTGAVADSASYGRRQRDPLVGRSVAGDNEKGLATGPVAGRFNGPLDHTRSQRQPPGWQADGADDRLFPGPAESIRPVAGSLRPGLSTPQQEVLQGPGREAEGRAAGQLRRPRRGAFAFFPSDFILCTDGKIRRTQPGIYPLAHGVPGRVGRLRAYGNAIVPQVAAEFVAAFMEALNIEPEEEPT